MLLNSTQKTATVSIWAQRKVEIGSAENSASANVINPISSDALNFYSGFISNNNTQNEGFDYKSTGNSNNSLSFNNKWSNYNTLLHQWNYQW